MGEINERVYELQQAAIDCGLTLDQAVDDVAEASEAAGKEVVPEPDENKPDKWWPAFFRYYSARCVGRFQSKLSNPTGKTIERIWLEHFEPLWLAGCNYMKEITIQKIRGNYTKLASQLSHGRTIDEEDSNKLKQYCNSVADDLDKVLSSEIVKFKAAQRKALIMTFHLDIPIEDIPKPDVSDAEILDEMCKMQSGFKVGRVARDKGLSQAEINILRYKANPFYSGAFRVSETANENEITKWLKHPMIDHIWPDHFVMSMAAQTPIPVKMMVEMLRKLLQEHYEECWKEAETRVRSKKSTS